MTALSSRDAWAVGYSSPGVNTGQTLVERWNGKTWTVQTTPNPSATGLNELYGVAAVSSRDAWAVGYSSPGVNTGQTLVERWNGKTWTVQKSPSPVHRRQPAQRSTDAQTGAALLAQQCAAGFAAGVDTEPRLMVHSALAEGILNEALAEQASLVLVGQRSADAASALGTSAEAVAAATPVQVAILMGDLKNIKEVELIRTEDVRPGPEAANAAHTCSRDRGAGG